MLNRLICVKGNGAWDDWSYEIMFTTSAATSENITIKNINKTKVFVESLHASTLYYFYVRGYSSVGHGPWSKAFATITSPTGNVDNDISYYRRNCLKRLTFN